MKQNLFLQAGDIVVVPKTTSASLTKYLRQVLTPARDARELDEIRRYFEDTEFFVDTTFRGQE